jgi:hypothetical protein
MKLRNGWVAAGVVLAVLAAGSPANAVSWDNVTPHVDSGQSVPALQKLAWSPVPAANLAAVDTAYSSGALAADGSPGLAQVYAHTDHQMADKTSATCAGPRSAISAADAAYTLAAWCFSGTDETSDAWVPQAVTSSQDAEQASGYSAGGDEMVALWRHEASADDRGPCPGVPADPDRSVGLRASFIQRPYTDGTHSAYRHVVLAVPGAPGTNGLTFAPVCDVHGGGVAWYGPYLFVSKHGSGILVFDTRRTYKIPNDTACGPDHAAPGTNDIGQIADPSGGQQLCAAGYRYVLFEVGSFHTTPAGCSTTPSTLTTDLCFSSLSLRWSDDSLVTSEYRNSADLSASGADVRIANWSTADLINRITTGSTGAVTATRLAAMNFEGVQGVVERPDSTTGDPQFFVDRTLPGSDGSQLWYEQDGDGVCPARGTFVDNAEDMSYWVDSSGNGHLWTFTEYANRRMLVRVYTNEYNDAPSGCPTQ